MLLCLLAALCRCSTGCAHHSPCLAGQMVAGGREGRRGVGVWRLSWLIHRAMLMLLLNCFIATCDLARTLARRAERGRGWVLARGG